MQSSGCVLSPEAIRKFTDLRAEAIAAVTARFYETFPAACEQFGADAYSPDAVNAVRIAGFLVTA